MAIQLSDNHPFNIAALATNTYNHSSSTQSAQTTSGVEYRIWTFTPISTAGYDFDRFYTFAGANNTTPIKITYSIDASVSQARSGFKALGVEDFTKILSNPRSFNDVERTNILSAIREYESFINVDFRQVSGFADINFFRDTGSGGFGFGAHEVRTTWSPGGNYTINNTYGLVRIDQNDPYQYVHELGHVLTLKHPGARQFDTEFPILAEEYQASKYTIMYYDVTTPGVGDHGEEFSRHLQLFDVYALQQRFGANMNYNTGDTIYTADSFDGWRQVLWDAGGNDTLDFSARSSNQTFDLREGHFSTLGGFFTFNSPDNLAIAFGAIIENAIGGVGDDTLIGNDAGNDLYGGGGHDLLQGNSGSDWLEGGFSSDQLFGGSGIDSLFGDFGNDSLSGGFGNDDLDGGAGNDVGHGDRGFDTVRGGDGSDDVHGDGGNDRVFGDAGNDTVHGGTGFDRLDGGADDDVLNGDGGNDTLRGAGGADTLNGGDGVDVMFGGSGADEANGGDGADRIRGEAGNDVVNGGLGDDRAFGSFGFDTLNGDSGNDYLDGNGGNDELNGDAGNDTLIGNFGFDALDGGVGFDRLEGAGGNDTVTGGSGNDTFVFASGDGEDVYTDFTAGAGSEDVIEISGFGTAFDEASEVIAAASQDGADVLIDFGTGDTIRLLNTTLADLHQR